MKIEIINKPMFCWDDDESQAREHHVLAKITECNTMFPYKTVVNENTYLNDPGRAGRSVDSFKNAKPLPETVELTVTEISKLLGKTVKVIE